MTYFDDRDDEIFTELKIPDGHTLNFEVAIGYHGPFTKGHETGASWRYKGGTFVLSGGKKKLERLKLGFQTAKEESDPFSWPPTLRNRNAPANFRIGAKSHGRSIDRGMRSLANLERTHVILRSCDPQGAATQSSPRSPSPRLASQASSADALSPTHPAYAAAVSTADLPQNAPSFAPLIDRVKASVVSVKVKIPAEDAEREAPPPARARWKISPRRSRSSSSSSAACPMAAARRRRGQAPDDDGRRLRLLRFG